MIKKLLFLWLIVTAAVSCSPEKNAPLSGTIRNYADKDIFMLDENGKTVAVAHTDPEGKFNFNPEIKHPQTAYLKIDFEQLELYLVPKETLHIDADYHKLDRVHYEGRMAGENEYLNRKNNLLKNVYLGKAMDQDWEGFLSSVRLVESLIYSFMPEYPDTEFLKREQYRLYYVLSNKLFLYPQYRKAGGRDDGNNAPAGFFAFVNLFDPSDPTILKYPEGKEFLISYVEYYRRLGGQKLSLEKTVEELIPSLFQSPELTGYALAEYTLRHVAETVPETRNELFGKLAATVKDTASLQALARALGQSLP